MSGKMQNGVVRKLCMSERQRRGKCAAVRRIPPYICFSFQQWRPLILTHTHTHTSTRTTDV